MTAAFLAIAVLLVLIVLVASHLRVKANETSEIVLPVETKAPASVAVLEEYFRSKNLSGLHINDVVADIGTWNNYDDWDCGRLIFEWTRPGLRVSVGTQSRYIRKVWFLDPDDGSRFGIIQETILDKRFDIEGHDG